MQKSSQPFIVEFRRRRIVIQPGKKAWSPDFAAVGTKDAVGTAKGESGRKRVGRESTLGLFGSGAIKLS